MSNNVKKPNFPQPDKSQFKTLLVWAGIILLILGLVSISSQSKSQTQTFDIKQLVTAANEDQILELTIQGDSKAGENWYLVEGIIKNPAFKASSKDADKTPRELKFAFNGRISEDVYSKLTNEKSPWKITERPSHTDWADIFITILPIIILIAAAYFFIMRPMRMTGKNSFNYGKSKAKLLTPDKDRTTFDDVAGCDESKEEVAEIVDFLKDPARFTEIGAKIPKGLLMVGPPGTGKTLLSRAIAGEANVPFYSISGSDFVELFVGVGAARVRDMFEQAKKTAPCIIFIDEIDAVGRQRGAGLGGGNDEREQTLNSLLVEMDGFEGHEGIIVIAATNRPDVLDSALLRPGRFDRQVMIDLPDLIGREAILKVHARKIKIEPEVNLETLAKLTPGCSGADLENLLNEAAITATRNSRKQVTMADIDEARDKVFYGRERRKLMEPAEKKLTAYHEGGHALIQALIDSGNMPVHKVTIIPRGRSLGSTMFAPQKDIFSEKQTNLVNRICATLGGRVAEEIVFGDITTGASEDIKMVTGIARKMVCDWGMSPLGPISYGGNQDHVFLGKEIAREHHLSERTSQLIDEEIKKIVEAQLSRARDILNTNRSTLDKIAEALLEHETIDGKQLKEIIDCGKIITFPAPKKSVEESAQENPQDEKTSRAPSANTELATEATMSKE